MYNIGQKLTFTSLNGNKEEVTIIKRKIDYINGVIDEPNYNGNFDYFAQVERKGQIDYIFCNHNELS